MALDGDVPAVRDFAVGVKSRWVGGDLRAFWPSFADCPKKWRFLTDFFSLSNWCLYRDDLDLGDPLPFFAWAIYKARRTLNKKFSKKPIGDQLEGVWE